MLPGVPTCGIDEPCDDVARRLGGWEVAYVVSPSGCVIGEVRPRALASGASRPVSDVMLEGPSTYRPNVGVERLAGRMSRHGLKRVPITTPDGLLLGLFRLRDAEAALRGPSSSPAAM